MNPIEVVHLYGFKRTHYQAGECSLRIGDVLDLRSMGIHYSPIQKKIFPITFPGICFGLDMEIWLREILREFFDGPIMAELSSFLDKTGTGEEFPDPPPFVPESWKNDPLAFSVDYITMQNIQCGYETGRPVTATINIGGYVTFSNVPIYDPIMERYIEPKLINSQCVTDAINRLIKSKRTKKEIETVCAVGHHISTDYMVCEDLSSS
ncbi:MAG: hypothetical protein WC386_01655 [Candidatus Paceibacterota bacterium]|jgi:hypothetical protein